MSISVYLKFCENILNSFIENIVNAKWQIVNTRSEGRPIQGLKKEHDWISISIKFVLIIELW